MKFLGRPWTVFGAMGPAILVLWAMLGASLITMDLKPLAQGKIGNEISLIGRDYVNMWFGGKRASDGAIDRIYDRTAYMEDLQTETGLKDAYNFSYPPHMLMAAIPLGQLPYIVSLIAWTVLTFGLFWHAARPWLADVGLPGWSVLVLPASVINLWAGHFGFLIGALALYGWRYAASDPKRAGLAFAAMTVKPHMGLLVPFMLAAKMRWATIIWAGIFTLILLGLSVAMFGMDPWHQWFGSTLAYQTSLASMANSKAFFTTMMPTVERFALSLGAGPTLRLIFQIGFAAATIALLLKAWRKGTPVADLGLLAIIATFLILPYSFHYDMVAFDLALIVLVARLRDRLLRWELIVLGLAYLIPIIQMPLAFAGLHVSAVLIIAALAILVRKL